MLPPKISISKKAHYIPLAVDVDFFELFKKVRARFGTCYLAESLGEQNAASRYSLIGFSPRHVIRARGDTLFVDDVLYEVANPYEVLKTIVPQDCIARRYAGGLFGYMSYEAINYFEPTLNLPEHAQFDQFVFGVYTDGLVHDTMTGQVSYFFYDEDRSTLIAELLAAPVVHPAPPIVRYQGDTLTADEHKAIVERTKQEIIAGNTFQCEVGFKSAYEITGCPIAIYGRLRQVNPSPYMYYVQHEDFTILGASPELLVKVDSREIEAAPLAGTTRRGTTAAEDVYLARTLLNDPKEVAEHVMLVDMHRSDVGRVATFGTVKVVDFMEIKKYSHVQHIASTIRGILKPTEDMFSALKALLPGGVLSGAPKIESIKIIAENEKTPRGPYGGALGTFGFNGDCTFAIPIRSLYIHGTSAFTQTSSGIVYDSDPDKEYAEIKNKLAAMRSILSEFTV